MTNYASLSATDTTVRSASRRHGFTLIELVVVAAIVAISLALLFRAVSGIMKSSKQKAVAIQARALVHAIKSYRTVYGQWPGQTQGDHDTTYDGADHAGILAALTNNPRDRVFIESPETLAPNGYCADYWGRAYLIAIDEDGDGVAHMGATNASFVSAFIVTNVPDTVAVASWGPDPGDLRERVYSWTP